MAITIGTNYKTIFQQQVASGVPFRIFYKGKTTDATETELFIEHGPGSATDRHRLYIPQDGAVRVVGSCMALTSGGDLAYASSTVGDATASIVFANNDGGTSSLDAGGAFTEDYDSLTISPTPTFSIDDTNDCLLLKVIGKAATTLYWFVECEVVGMSLDRFLQRYGDDGVSSEKPA